jgi:23S rRNA pseudouridine955/2504/2580 synthase
MKAVLTRTVSTAEGEQRLDRWFKKNYPDLGHIQLQKLLRSGQVRVDGARAEANTRVQPGQAIRIPPLPDVKPVEDRPRGKAKVPERLVSDLLKRVLYRDDEVIVLNKPAGLAVQGGTGTKVHLDGALEGLKFGYPEKPRLVHRLDRDTAGVIVLARTQDAARKLADSFRRHKARKYYWAVTLGVPELKRGKIDLPLLKSTGAFEKMEANEEEGDEAITYYAVVDKAAEHAAWVALWPVTGRTHQLRAHMAAINAPLLGDPKYGQKDEYDVSRQLHLFARRLIMPHPTKGMIDVTAPLPEHFKPAWQHFGFQGSDDDDPFAELDPLAERRAVIFNGQAAEEKRRAARKEAAALAAKRAPKKPARKGPPVARGPKRPFVRDEEAASGTKRPFERKSFERKSFDRRERPERSDRPERDDNAPFARKPFRRKGPSDRSSEKLFEPKERNSRGAGRPFERRERPERAGRDEGRSFERKQFARKEQAVPGDKPGAKKPFERKSGPPRGKPSSNKPTKSKPFRGRS